MAMKEWFRRLQPVQLYFMLALSIAFVLTELVVSHITHALTLLVGAYHMLCNIIALTGCIITIKYGKDSQSKHAKHKKHDRNKVNDINNVLHGSHVSIGEVLTSQAATPGGDSNRHISTTTTHAHAHAHSHNHDKSLTQRTLLKNTFGWARIDVIVMLICFVFLASLCFSLLLEALQTLVHIDHHDEMHHPIPVMIVGAIGLLLNGLCYLLIGGYTFHQGSFLHVTASGDVVLDRVVTKDSVKQGQRRLSRSRLQTGSGSTAAQTTAPPSTNLTTSHQHQQATIFTQTSASVVVVPSTDIIQTNNASTTPIIIMETQQQTSDGQHCPKSSGEESSSTMTKVYTTKKTVETNPSNNHSNRNRQGAREMARDVLSCVYVIICSLIVYYTESPVAKFVDPVVSIISASHLLWLSYPYMKESGLILLQTMPDTINIDSLKSELLAAFPDIINIHDLHVWQLTANKVISTAHIIFQDPKVYAKITKEVTDFFISQGITQVTVQPEFSQICINKDQPVLRQKLITTSNDIPDIGEDHKCLMRCQGLDCTSKHCCAHHILIKENTKIHKRWTTSKEIIPSNSIHDLKSIRIHPFELVVRSSDVPPEAATPSTLLSTGTATSRSLSLSPPGRVIHHHPSHFNNENTTSSAVAVMLKNQSKSVQDVRSCNTESGCERQTSTLHSNYDSLNNVSSNVIIRNCDNNMTVSSSDTILSASNHNSNNNNNNNNNNTTLSSTHHNNSNIILQQETH